MRTVAAGLALVMGCVGQPLVAAPPSTPPRSEDGQKSARSPLEGTWKANLERSRRDPNHLFESLTLEFTVSGDTVTLVYSGINMSGEEESATTTLQADGKERPVSEQAPGVMLVTRWVSTHMLETVTTNEGESVGRGTYEVSADGKTLIATVSGTDAGGRRFENIVVADRESSSSPSAARRRSWTSAWPRWSGRRPAEMEPVSARRSRLGSRKRT